MVILTLHCNDAALFKPSDTDPDTELPPELYREIEEYDVVGDERIVTGNVIVELLDSPPKTEKLDATVSVL